MVHRYIAVSTRWVLGDEVRSGLKLHVDSDSLVLFPFPFLRLLRKDKITRRMERPTPLHGSSHHSASVHIIFIFERELYVRK
jgi:hypothetical protein